MNVITTHVLDTARGRPAAGMPVLLERWTKDRWEVLGKNTTDADGRVNRLLPETRPLEPGIHRLTFDTQAYFASQNLEGFYPQVTVVFEVRDARQRYHLPLLLSPFGYSTYRGS